MAAWKVLAEGKSLDDLHSTGVLDKIPHNTPFDIELEVMWAPLAKLFDIAGAEWAAQRFLEVGTIVEDVEEKGGKVIIHCKANAVQIVPLLFAIAAIFATIAFFIISVRVSAPILGAISIGMIVVVIGAILLVGFLAYRGALPKVTMGGTT